MARGVLYSDAQTYPLSPKSSRVVTLPNATYQFYLSGTTISTPVYQDAGLTTPFASNPQANSSGLFPPIYLSSAVVYRWMMFDQYGRRLVDVDPYVPPATFLGLGELSLNTLTGVVTVSPTMPGGSGAALTLIARPGGIALYAGNGSGGNELEFANTGINSGIQTATFTATNKPGTGTTAPSLWWPLLINGIQSYIPLWQ
jgi:hypothetical protein